MISCISRDGRVLSIPHNNAAPQMNLKNDRFLGKAHGFGLLEELHSHSVLKL